MKHTLTICAIIALSGCGDFDKTDYPKPDQCIRVERFDACMKALPAGPVSTHYNDWDEVVLECEAAAYRQSLRKQSQIKKECQA